MLGDITYLLVSHLCIVGVIAWLSYYAFNRYLNSRSNTAFAQSHGCLPAPRLRNRWPLGVDRLLQIWQANVNDRLMDLYLFHSEDIGNTFEQKFLGTTLYRTIDPENVEAMLSTQFTEFSFGLRRQIFFPLLGDGIFTQDGAAWKHSRKALRPQFSKQHFRNLDMLKEHVANLVARIPKNNEVVDLQPLFCQFTLDTTTAFLFGKSVYSLLESQEGRDNEFADSFNNAQEFMAKRFRLFNLYWLVGGRKFRECCKSTQTFVEEMIQQRHESTDSDQEKADRYTFFDAIAHVTKDSVELRDQLINMLLAGRDTTASLLTWTFHLLVRHQHVLEKLREEIDSIAQDKTDLRREDLKQMKYLTNVLKETLRLFPSVPVNIRKALQTTTLPTGGGPDRLSPILVQQGCNVGFCIYAMQRRKDLYGADANDFRPERWEDKDLPLYRNKTHAAWGYIPFNGGPRACLGHIWLAEDFGLIEASYAIVRILQTFPDMKAAAFERPQNQAWMAYSSHHKLGVPRISKERQRMTLVMSASDGCPIQFG